MVDLIALKWKRLMTIVNLLRRAASLNYRRKKDEMYNLICNELLKLGGVYVKFLQGVVVQSWAMQRWQGDNKLDIFENIQSKIDNPHHILSLNLGTQIDRISDISQKPIAIGSFGHVYKAILDNHKPIIIKILSPEISKTLKFDLKLLKFFWYSHMRIVKLNKGINFKHIFNDFKRQTLKEIDYVGEAKAANYQYSIYKDSDQIVIPQTYLKLCATEVIIQDYIEGISVANLLKMQEADPQMDMKKYIKTRLNSDLVKQLQAVAYEIIWGTFHYQQIIGDPHPGNIILMDNNRIGIIDFGIVTQGSKNPSAYLKFLKAYINLDEKQASLEEFFISSLRFFGYDLYLALDKLSNLIPDGETRIDLNRELAKIMQKAFMEAYAGRNVANVVKSPKALVIFDRIANKHNRFGFNFKVGDAEILRTLITLTGLIDLLGIYQEVVHPTYHQAIAKVEDSYPDLKSLNETEISYNQAFVIAFGWMERVANRDPQLFRNMMSKLRSRSELIKKNVDIDEV